MPLREAAINHLKQYNNIETTDFYEFGINHGKSFYDINRYLNINGIRPHKIWGFDSFVGLPKEKEGLPIVNGWEEGYFNVQENMGLSSTDEVIREILKHINTDIPCELIAGYFDKTLTSELAINKDMKKASFIDIDVDLYQSTIDVFHFLINNDLLSNGCLINFDDWGGVEEYTGGESKAFQDIIKKYKLDVTEVLSTSPVRDNNGILHVQKVFKVNM